MSAITVDRQERVAVLTMNHEGENRFHPDFMNEMLALLDELEDDAGVGALVLTGGDPKFFCNGLDLAWCMAHAADPEALVSYTSLMNRMYRRWCLFPKGTVAAINGHVFAGGLFLAAHLDFRLMREDRGWACMPEVDMNIPLLPGMIAICKEVMTPAGFRRMYYTGERLGGPAAVEAGLVDAAVPAADLLPRSVELAAVLAAKRTDTFAEMKRRSRAAVVRALDEEDPPLFLPTLGFAVSGG